MDKNTINIAKTIKQMCKSRHIAVSELERNCGFSNGFINNHINSYDFPFKKLLAVCRYLDVPIWIFDNNLKKDIANYICNQLNDLTD